MSGGRLTHFEKIGGPVEWEADNRSALSLALEWQAFA